MISEYMPSFTGAILYILLFVFIRVIYGFLIKPNLRRRFYQKQGIHFSNTCSSLVGDVFNFDRLEKANLCPFSLYMELVKEDPNADFVGIMLGPLVMIAPATTEATKQLYEKIPELWDKHPLTQRMIGKYSAKSLVYLHTNDEWKRKRTICSNALGGQALKESTHLFVTCCIELFEKWRTEDYEQKGVFLIQDEFKELSFNLISRAVVGEAILRDDKYEIYKNSVLTPMTLRESIQFAFKHSVEYFMKPLSLLFPDFMHSKFAPGQREIAKNSEIMHNFLANIVTDRAALLKKEEEDEKAHVNKLKRRRNMLDFMIMAKDENGGKLQVEEIVNEVIEFTISGFDTMTKTFASMFYHLLKNPEVEAKIRAEIKRVIFDGKPFNPKFTSFKEIEEELINLLQFDKVQECEYLTYCIKETLRIDPPNPSFVLEVKDNCQMGNYKFKKGDIIYSALYPVQNHERYWANPRTFIPERFDSTSKHYLTPNGEKRDPFAYIPFSAGKRVCLGQTYGLTKMKYVAIMFLIFWDLKLSPELEERTADISFSMESKAELRLSCKQRNLNCD